MSGRDRNLIKEGAGVVLVVLGVSSQALAQTTFTEVASSAGVADPRGTKYSFTTAWGDYDNDGDQDLAVGNQYDLQFYQNNGNGTFSNVTTAAGLSGYEVTAGTVFGDYDNDGDLDLYTGIWGGAPKLWRNNGNGTFTDVAAAAGVTPGNSMVNANFVDYNTDGFIDLFLSSNNATPALYRSNQNGTFTEVVTSSGLPTASYHPTFADYDNDGDPDAFVGTPSNLLLYQNNGNGIFSNVTAASGLPSSSYPYPYGIVEDFDNDRDLDLFVMPEGGGSGACYLYRNNGNGIFTDITSAAGIAHNVTGGSRAIGADFDNNGGIDIYLMEATDSGMRVNAILWNNGNGTFTKTTGDLPTGNVFTCSASDYDNDGDVDVYVGVNGAPNLLYRNNGNANRWLQVKLAGTVSNKAGIGARVRVVAGGVAQSREVRGGEGSKSMGSLPVEFGFGSTSTVDSLIIRWPSGIVQVQTNVATNQLLTVTESAMALVSTVSPSRNATSVERSSAVTTTFSTDMNATTITSNSFRVRGEQSGPKSGSVTYSGGNRTATFTPNTPFFAGERVFVQLTSGIQATNGATLTNGYAFSFRIKTNGSGGIQLSRRTDWDAPTAQSKPVTGDLNGDGRLDLFISLGGYGYRVMLFTGASPTITDVQTTNIYETRLADLDGDGDLDVVGLNNNNPTFLWNSGSGTFPTTTSISTSWKYFYVEAADLDADGDIDLLGTAGSLNASFELHSYLNNGSGNFTLAHSAAGSSNEMPLAVDDVNGDGIVDVVTPEHYTNPGVYVYLGSGSGAFSAPTFYPRGGAVTNGGARLDDLDGDGDLDFPVGQGNEGLLAVLANAGNASFSTGQTLTGIPYPSGMSSADMDGNGTIDLVYHSYEPGKSLVVLSNGGSSLSIGANISLSPDYPLGLALGDIDSDGDVDAFVSMVSSPFKLIFFENGPVSAPATQPIYGQSASSLAFGTVNVGASRTQPLRLRNIGTAALTVSAMSDDSDQFSFSPGAPLTINAGDSTTVTVTFTPTSQGNKSGTLTSPTPLPGVRLRWRYRVWGRIRYHLQHPAD